MPELSEIIKATKILERKRIIKVLENMRLAYKDKWPKSWDVQEIMGYNEALKKAIHNIKRG